MTKMTKSLRWSTKHNPPTLKQTSQTLNKSEYILNYVILVIYILKSIDFQAFVFIIEEHVIMKPAKSISTSMQNNHNLRILLILAMRNRMKLYPFKLLMFLDQILLLCITPCHSTPTKYKNSHLKLQQNKNPRSSNPNTFHNQSNSHESQLPFIPNKSLHEIHNLEQKNNTSWMKTVIFHSWKVQLKYMRRYWYRT